MWLIASSVSPHGHTARAGLHFGRRGHRDRSALVPVPTEGSNVAGPSPNVDGGLIASRSADSTLMTDVVPVWPGRGRRTVPTGREPRSVVRVPATHQHPSSRTDTPLIAPSVSPHGHTARAGLHFGWRGHRGRSALVPVSTEGSNVAGPPRTVGRGLIAFGSADPTLMTDGVPAWPGRGRRTFPTGREPTPVVRVPATHQHPGSRTDMRLIASSVVPHGHTARAGLHFGCPRHRSCPLQAAIMQYLAEER